MYRPRSYFAIDVTEQNSSLVLYLQSHGSSSNANWLTESHCTTSHTTQSSPPPPSLLSVRTSRELHGCLILSVKVFNDPLVKLSEFKVRGSWGRRKVRRKEKAVSRQADPDPSRASYLQHIPRPSLPRAYICQRDGPFQSQHLVLLQWGSWFDTSYRLKDAVTHERTKAVEKPKLVTENGSNETRTST